MAGSPKKRTSAKAKPAPKTGQAPSNRGASKRPSAKKAPVKKIASKSAAAKTPAKKQTPKMKAPTQRQQPGKKTATQQISAKISSTKRQIERKQAAPRKTKDGLTVRGKDRRKNANAAKARRQNRERRSAWSLFKEWYTFISPATRIVVTAVIALIAVFCIYSGVNAVAQAGRIHPGVSVQGIDVGGMTQEEAAETLEAELSPRLADGEVIVFANDAEMQVYDPSTADFSVPEGSMPTKWRITAGDLGADINGEVLARSAYDATRGDGSFINGLKAWTVGIDVDAYLNCNLDSFNNYVNSIDATIGKPVVNADLSINNGVVSVVPCEAGNLVDRREFLAAVSQGILEDGGDFVPVLHEVQPVIDDQSAQVTADSVQMAIDNPVTLTFGESTWTLGATAVGSCVSTRIARGNNDPQLVAYIDLDKSKQVIEGILGDAKQTGAQDAYIDVSSGEPVIIPSVPGFGPDVTLASTELQDIVFGGREDRTINMIETQIDPEITTADVESWGVTTLISSYSTDATSAYDEKRHNMAVACDAMSYVVVAPGEQWSWNEYVGDTTEDKGYIAGHTVESGVVASSMGGGICQVATTIFNSVYEAGLQIDERHNHSMYFPEYPEGRDATISYGTYDLKWTNNTDHYIIMQMVYDGSYVTCNLYGTDPGYTVETDVGEWYPGSHYETVTVNDPAYPAGFQGVTQGGSDGRSITVVRHVYKDGVEVSTDVFDSYYSPTAEVITIGTGA